ncbi:Xaa-Pro dipeptidyl-peptidase [Streptomyces sp. NBC_00237]|uniref:Xaa-Pro dipeptidyl-peptidase n=1 Tax=Streptomyces sp. NBC_00237 TaxID=2975687 RepID=UPI00225488B1|nr:Xaa-Pro dipeptidyl-peptidase [Streptomyces sp. NBC_00237]MCX5202894.1 Xaa-Pro dipeptidyl-peptidase [Streptomyces sp. NBC_00237]
MPIPARAGRPRRRSLVPLTVAAMTAVLLAPAGSAQGADAPSPPTEAAARPTESRPVYAYDNAVRESVWVDTRIDGDKDGRTDRVAVDIVRPRELDRSGRRIPVIMDASPYYRCCGRGNESQKKTYDANGKPLQLPLFYDNYFVPRGYGYVAVDFTGTSRSDGCVDIGGRSEIASAKAVIDWLNGRGTGYTTRTGNDRTRASWSNGDTGMIGKSWDGTIANGTAATGVEGLKTIVPIGAISSWYDYYFQQGADLYDGGPEDLAAGIENAEYAQRCAPTKKYLSDNAPLNGDVTAMWADRDFVPDARKVKASVFAVHGQQDLNVRMRNFGTWWNALAKQGVDRKVWLSQTGHVDPFDFRRAEWVRTLHRWFDHELMGYDNGVDREPMADIERAPDQWSTDKVWPPRSTESTKVRPDNGSSPGVGTLSLKPAEPGAKETFTDNPALDEDTWAAKIDTGTPEKAGFATKPLSRDLRLSGTGKVTLKVTPSTASANLSAVLVDLGPDTIRDYAARGEGITTLTTRSCWGASTAADSACFKDTRANTKAVDHTVFSRGWASLAHYRGDGKARPLTPGTTYEITIDLAASDHVVPAGHRLALIVGGTDAGLVEAPDSRPTVDISLSGTSARLPVVGGERAFARATSGNSQAAPLSPGARDSVPVPQNLSRLPGETR